MLEFDPQGGIALCLKVSHPDRPVIGARDDDRPALPLADGHGAYVAVVTDERAEHWLTRVRIPHPHRPVATAGDDDRPALPLADRAAAGHG